MVKLTTMQYLSFLIILLAVSSCSTPKSYTYFRTGEVTCVTNDSRLVTVNSSHHGGSVEQAQLFAERNAVENLLFRGIPGCYDVPIVSNEAASMNSHPEFYKWLIQSREYERYITDRTLSHSGPSQGPITVTMDITFDVSALRKEMESQGVIKKFGI